MACGPEVFMLSKRRNVVYFIEGLGLGIAAGCIVGVLYAPRAGKRTRRQLARALEDGADYVASKAQDTTEYLREGALRLQDEAKDLLDRGQTVIDMGKARLEDAIETGRHLYRTAAR
jgi:gas vesicle protein